jgi:spore coat polysaccharide biosynthesis protein SpsF
MKRVAIIQARMSSSRLPGKVLAPIDGAPMIALMLRRVARARLLDDIVVATSVEHSDDVLADEVNRNGFKTYRGSLADVLSRFAAATREFAADVVVRLTGDCPLTDPDIIDKSLSILIDGNFDYVSNVDPPTYPNGLDVEAFTSAAVLKAHKEARLPSDREHVTPYIRRNKAIFRQSTIRACVDLSALRWTVDHPDDLEFVRSLVKLLPAGASIVADRFDFLRAMDLAGSAIPTNIHPRNESYDAALDISNAKSGQ